MANPLRTRWRRAPTDVILLVLAAFIAGLGVGLLGSSNAEVGATLLGGVLVLGGTYRTIQVTREGQITERFRQAVEHLDTTDSAGRPREVVVLGGLCAFKQIASESERYDGPIMEILTAYVRRRVSRPAGQLGQADAEVPACEHKLPTDVQAALAVFKRRTPPSGALDLDLRSTDLRNARLPDAALQGAILSRADLRCAHLEGAHLERAKLQRADLRGADLRGAHLRGAELEGADLRERADLRRAEGLEEQRTVAVSDVTTMWP